MKIIIHLFSSTSSGWDKETETLQIIELPEYNIHVEKVTYGDSEPFEMRVCRTKEGHYIGDEKVAKMLVEKYGIKPELATADDRVCSIGWSERDKKFYGWSHRAIYGFKIGDKVKPGDCAYKPSTKAEWIKDMLRWHNDSHNPIKSYMWDEESQTLRIQKANRDLSSVEEFHKDYLGEGEWEAKTLDDCRKMAMRFAESVSSSEPEWWNEPSDNVFAKGMTKGQEIIDYLERHDVPKEDGRHVFYHATTNDRLDDIKRTGIRAGSYLAFSKKAAIDFAKINKHVKSKDITVFTVKVLPWQIIPGVHPTLRENYLVN